MSIVNVYVGPEVPLKEAQRRVDNARKEIDMIISKGIAVGEIVTLKIVTGEELIGKLTEIGDDYYMIHRPLVLVMSQQGLGLQQWTFTANVDKAFKISKDKIIMIAETVKEMSSQYIEGTTGIKLA